MKISKIVITGGPCGGKSTGLIRIKEAISEYGYEVIFVSESATELISGGVAPWTCGTNAEFQKCIIDYQLKKEDIYEKAVKTMKADKVLIVCDRGANDNKAYMDNNEFSEVLTSLNLSEIDLRDRYDAVFHLVTAANGAEKFYTTANNQARTETVEEAIIIDNNLISAWTGHPHLRIIDNSTDFENKIQRLINEILSFLGEKGSYEIERKFLIEYPDINLLESLPNCRKVEIIQTYLTSEQDEQIRIRQRGEKGNYIYFKTIKRHISPIKRIEIEERISEKEYLDMLMQSSPDFKQIRKTRYCFTYKGQYFEIDVFPFWKDKAIIELELSDENAIISFPEEIKVIKEVTEDSLYGNYNLAKLN